MDVFPQDHELLDKDDEEDDLGQKMSEKLSEIVNNKYNTDDPKKILGYMFVYDAGNKLSFDTLHTLIETIKELEKSEQKGRKSLSYATKKIVIGNKKDMKDRKQILEKTDFKKIENMRFREVSALTN